MSDQWTNTWPSEPGWYWTWDPNTSRRPEPGRVMLLGPKARRSTLHFVGGAPTTRGRWPSLHWGPRIEVPDAPDGTPGTRYVVATLSDQTWRYLAGDGQWTTVCAEAKIFDSRAEAKSVALEDAKAHADDRGPWPTWVEAIDDLDEFRSREDTW